MTIQFFDCAQNSPEWFASRRGLPTASKFHAILAQGKGFVRRAYLYQLAAEIITGESVESFQSAAMARGKEMEEEARRHYSLMRDVDPVQVGFIFNTNIGAGASPDSLIGEDGLLEIKTQRSDLWIATFMSDVSPPEHRAQCQGALLVSCREWIDISIYWPGMPKFIKREARDSEYIVKLKGEIDRFNDELQSVVAKVRACGEPTC